VSVVYHAPGARWVFVVGRSALVAVDPATPAEVVDALWSLVREDDVTIEAIVGAIPLASQDDRSFAAVVGPLAAAVDECALTAVVRGSAAVDVHSVGGSRRFGAHGAVPWLLAEFGSVTAVTLGDAGSEPRGSATRTPHALPLERAVACGDELVWALAPPTILDAAPVERRDAAPDGEPAGGADTIPSGRSRPAPPTGGGPGEPDEGTVVVRGRTAERDIPEELERVPPRPFVLRFAGGETHEVREPVIVGRSPRGRSIRDGRATLVTVPSPGKSVSGTHVRFEATGSSVTVIDEHSTNGTVVTPDGGAGLRLRPGGSLALGGRAHVELGDGIIIEIIPPEER